MGASFLADHKVWLKQEPNNLFLGMRSSPWQRHHTKMIVLKTKTQIWRPLYRLKENIYRISKVPSCLRPIRGTCKKLP